MRRFTRFIIPILFSVILLTGCSAGSTSYGPTPTFTPRPTPWGPPAKVEVSLPASIPCRMSGNRCADWSFTVNFKSENNIAGQVENIRMVFVSKDGVVYAEGGYPTWVAVKISIPANGSAQYQGTAKNPSDPDLKGGRMDFFYYGYDDNGNKFSGKISVLLA